MKQKGKKRLSFGRRLLIFLAGIFATLGLFGMILCVINPLIAPDKFVWFSFFGLAFWPLLIFNILMFVILFLLKSRRAVFISLIAIAVSIPGFKKSYSAKKSNTDEGNIKIMTYNIAMFHSITDKSKSVELVENDIIEIINSQNPDIVCLQESRHWNDEKACRFCEKINCKYFFYNANSGTEIIFSKYPLEDDAFTDAFNKINYGVAKLVKGGSVGKFYLECVHLKSFMINNDEIAYVTDARKYIENSETVGKSLMNKLILGFKNRTSESEFIVENLPDKDKPLIICGDFNDTPLSFTYHRMSDSGMTDAFLKAGSGIGKTYCGKLPLLRIDYFWTNDLIVPMTFETLKFKQSDHYPVVMSFNVTH
ncbi:MAG: endonuclease/exonuclease/phosphatase family protein [Candidatus Limimorpha sp.]